MKISLLSPGGRRALDGAGGEVLLDDLHTVIEIVSSAGEKVRLIFADGEIMVPDGVFCEPVRLSNEYACRFTVASRSKSVSYALKYPEGEKIESEFLANLMHLTEALRLYDELNDGGGVSVSDLLDAQRQGDLSLLCLIKPLTGFDNDDLQEKLRFDLSQKVRAICSRPKRGTRTEEIVQDVGLVKQTSINTLMHLASHTEHWKARTLSSLVPKRLLSVVIEDELNIYENLFFRDAVIEISDYVNRQIKRLDSASRQKKNAEDMDRYAKLMGNWKTARIMGELLPAKEEAGFLNEGLSLRYQQSAEEWKRIEVILRNIRNSSFYRQISTRQRIGREIFQTNIIRNAFEMTNSPKHTEYYKWTIAWKFRPAMEEALEASDGDFPKKLYEVKRLTANLIDSYTQPFNGLVNFARKEPVTVRGMFRDLFAANEVPWEEKEQAIFRFLDKSLALREKYYPESYLYKDDLHSVTGYLFLYDPDHNYLYKYSHCREFADCIEFYDDWGTGTGTKLEIFNRMCDECIEAINNSPALLATAKSRFAIKPGEMHPDTAKHILLFDMIYCSSRSTYNLLKGIHYVVPKSRERQLMQERKEKALELKQALDEANGKAAELERALGTVSEAVVPGKTVRHKSFGTGKILAVNDGRMTCSFDTDGDKDLGVKLGILNGLITVDGLELSVEQIDLMKDEGKIRSAVSLAEKAFAPYAEYLD